MRIARPESLEQALDLLRENGGKARVVGGGTALAILLRERLLEPDVVVALDRIPALHAIEVDEQRGVAVLGALVTHAAVERSGALHRRVPFLGEVFRLVGNVRVRSVATVGGVVAEADYASDPPAALIALGARVRVAGPAGLRVVPLQEFYRGFFATDLREDELVAAVEVPFQPSGAGFAYAKYVTRSSEDRPCLGVAGGVQLDRDGRCELLRVVVGAATEIPLVGPEVEREAIGRELTPELAREIGSAYAEAARTISDSRGSADYRRQMIRVWVPRVLATARERALGAV